MLKNIVYLCSPLLSSTGISTVMPVAWLKLLYKMVYNIYLLFLINLSQPFLCCLLCFWNLISFLIMLFLSLLFYFWSSVLTYETCCRAPKIWPSSKHLKLLVPTIKTVANREVTLAVNLIYCTTGCYFSCSWLFKHVTATPVLLVCSQVAP